ncbi:solute carrier family 25 member 35 isoform X2 [Cephus cinctus]|uniref:Solute carrier family 25 member 35 isoform X2 n=1 Tax=Cephus cinctus TaxID=211228 RepID=A0AAJ7FT01_CEPCN|nr:solute carrier family 25 member 35 isoform X2 [Cephus cinctus]
MTEVEKATGKRAPGVEFGIGALAAVGAGFFTNPVDVVKSRLQLQGELEARGSYKRIYKNTIHAAYILAKHEGILALQAGIVPALGFQVVLNGIRLGVYNIALNHGIMLNEHGNMSIPKTILLTGTAGAFASVVGSPLYMLKTQMQTQSAAQSIAVGYQHQHTGTWSAFKHLWKEGGIASLYRGWYANIPRLFLGSSTQLTTFTIARNWLQSHDICNDRPILLTFLAASLGGSCVALTMQPFDVLATRLYNQGVDKTGKGQLYNGLLDALIKISKKEGFFGLYKGVFPTWMRIAPHTVLCLVFYEQINGFYVKLIT